MPSQPAEIPRMNPLLKLWRILNHGALVNNATAGTFSGKPVVIIECCALLVCLGYSIYHWLFGSHLISITSFGATVFCGSALWLTLRGTINAISLLAFFTFQTIALCVTSYYFGMRGLILVFPLTAGTFYFLEFKLALVFSVVIILSTTLCSLHVVDGLLALRVLIALALTTVLSASFSFVTASQYRKSRHEALHDFLTQIPNRRGFFHWLEQSLKHCQKQDKNLVLFFIDLDKFKAINDKLGHNVGDKLLQAFANRLLHTVRSEDLVHEGNQIANMGRLSGDEFAFATLEIPNHEEAQNLTQRLETVMSQPYVIDQETIHITISIGYCFAADAHWRLNELIDCADKHMYLHKRQGAESL